MGFDIAEQLGWRVPDVIVYPTGGGGRHLRHPQRMGPSIRDITLSYLTSNVGAIAISYL
jgi:hypothetical protein